MRERSQIRQFLLSIQKSLEFIVFRGILETYMKRFHFCLILFLIFCSVVSCGDSIKRVGINENSIDEDTAEDVQINEDTAEDVRVDEDTAEDIRVDKDTLSDSKMDDDKDNTSNEDDTNDSDITDNHNCDAVLPPIFVNQPEPMYIAPNNNTVLLICEAEHPCHNVTYQWYESPDGSIDSGIAIPNATNPIFETPVYTEKGIHFYYCVATTTALSDEIENNPYVISSIASVAYTTLPTVYINTPDSVEIISKEDWIKKATISIVGANNENWNFNNVETSIRGRGNSTWNVPKKPYNLQLNKAREIMGMPAHKRWVLLANYYDDSFMKNEFAFYLSELFELDWTVHGEFVDLVLNGKYHGLYWLGEAIKVDENRININNGNQSMTDNEDKDYLIEIDTYFDETVKFTSAIHQMPYMIKNDDYMVDENDQITSGGQARLERLQTKINNLEKLLYPHFYDSCDINCLAPDESYSKIIDIDSWAKLWLLNVIMFNFDFMTPRSAFFTFDSVNNIFKAGPVWDFDLSLPSPDTEWSWHYAEIWQWNGIYYNALLKSPAFVTRTKELWNKYHNLIDIEDVIESMRGKISTAAGYDFIRWWIFGYNDWEYCFSYRPTDEYCSGIWESDNNGDYYCYECLWISTPNFETFNSAVESFNFEVDSLKYQLSDRFEFVNNYMDNPSTP